MYRVNMSTKMLGGINKTLSHFLHLKIYLLFTVIFYCIKIIKFVNVQFTLSSYHINFT